MHGYVLMQRVAGEGLGQGDRARGKGLGRSHLSAHPLPLAEAKLALNPVLTRPLSPYRSLSPKQNQELMRLDLSVARDREGPAPFWS